MDEDTGQSGHGTRAGVNWGKRGKRTESINDSGSGGFHVASCLWVDALLAAHKREASGPCGQRDLKSDLGMRWSWGWVVMEAKSRQLSPHLALAPTPGSAGQSGSKSRCASGPALARWMQKGIDVLGISWAGLDCWASDDGG